MYSLLSPKNPIGGKSWSKPTISVPPSIPAAAAVVSSASEEAASVVVSASEAFVSAAVVAVLPDEQAVMDNAIIDASAAHNTLFFIIIFLLLYKMSSERTLNSRTLLLRTRTHEPRTYVLYCLLTQAVRSLMCYRFDTLSW